MGVKTVSFTHGWLQFDPQTTLVTEHHQECYTNTKPGVRPEHCHLLSKHTSPLTKNKGHSIWRLERFIKEQAHGLHVWGPEFWSLVLYVAPPHPSNTSIALVASGKFWVISFFLSIISISPLYEINLHIFENSEFLNNAVTLENWKVNDSEELKGSERGTISMGKRTRPHVLEAKFHAHHQSISTQPPLGLSLEGSRDSCGGTYGV